jgi:hypothetical protein
LEVFHRERKHIRFAIVVGHDLTYFQVNHSRIRTYCQGIITFRNILQVNPLQSKIWRNFSPKGK